MSRVELARRVSKEIVDLDWPLSDAVVKALGLLEREPDAGHALRGRLRELRSLRVGAYRIIYQVDGDERVDRVLAVRHRSVTYVTDSR
jgi:mRNA interferase RelE/StbE